MGKPARRDRHRSGDSRHRTDRLYPPRREGRRAPRQRRDRQDRERQGPGQGADEEIAQSIRYKAALQMHNPFQKIKRIQARPFTSLPAKFRKKRRTTWSDPNRGGAQVDSFLEGPSFDRDGHLWCVDIPFGRVFRIDPKGEWELVVQYDGWPNGLKIHKGGWIFIADPSGRVYRLRANGELQRLIDNAPSPNGITLNKTNTHVFVAITRSQQVWRLPLMAGGTLSKTGVAIQLSGGHAGPDGIEA